MAASKKSKRFRAAAAALRAVSLRFDEAGHAAKRTALARLAQCDVDFGPALPACHDLLLFLFAHPSDAAMRRSVEREFARIATLLKARRGDHGAHLEHQGLPHVDTVSRFGHDCVRWLLGHRHVRVAIDSYPEPTADLNTVLRMTLPSVEHNETTADLDNDALLDALKVPRSARLRFIVNELGRFEALPDVKDHLFDALDLFVCVTPTDRHFSRIYNRLPIIAPFYQRELLRDFDARALMDRPLPASRALDAASRQRAIEVIKNSLALTSRETDPCTHLDTRTLRLFDLERGLAVAIYGMVPARQLPLESYVGFTLFKNGLAAAYGGAWVLGPRANFGMNIFEPYRGGESGYLMCQVLRVYRQVFKADFFEVDAHQFGLDNPDGIATGAFWFYYRYGFRPLDAALARRAARERARLKRQPGSRSSEQTLLAMTGSNVALNFGRKVPTHLFDMTTRVTRMIQRRFGSDRQRAEHDCVARFEASTAALRGRGGLDAEQRPVLTEMALVAQALGIDDDRRLALMCRMVREKPRDVFAYQRLWLDYFAVRRRVA